MWTAVRILKTLDDPHINLGDIATENAPAWALGPEIPPACRAAAAKRGWSVQTIKVLISHHGAPRAGRRIVFFMESASRTRDLGPIEDPDPSQAPVTLSTILGPPGPIPTGLWAEGTLKPYDGVQYVSPYLSRRAAYPESEGTRRVAWSINHPGWSTRTREP